MKTLGSFQIDARFARYALLTGAALIAAKPAKASVVTTLLTGADFTSGSHSLDVNNDGFADFVFTGFTQGGVSGVQLMANSSSFPSHNDLGQIVENLVSGVHVYGTGAAIGTDLIGADGIAFGGLAELDDVTLSGPKFVGGEILDSTGDTHFGFAEFDATHFIGVAFETDVDAPIITSDLATAATAPEPGTLGMLALGAAGLELLRRRRAQRV
jgi:hypothetical protein